MYIYIIGFCPSFHIGETTLLHQIVVMGIGMLKSVKVPNYGKKKTFELWIKQNIGFGTHRKDYKAFIASNVLLAS